MGRTDTCAAILLLWSMGVGIAQTSAASAGSCYDMVSHKVKCDVSETSCSGTYYAPGYVSGRDSCCHCQASCSNISSSCSYYDSAGSCYDSSTHKVSCNVAEASCSGSYYAPGYVSGQSGCCHCQASCATVSSSCSYYDVMSSTSSGGTTGGATTGGAAGSTTGATTGSGPTSATSVGSCYDHTTHKVKCNVAEASCSGSYYAPGYVSGSSGCCHCQASCANISSSCSYYDATSSSGTTGATTGATTAATTGATTGGTTTTTGITTNSVSGASRQGPMLVLWLLLIGLAFGLAAETPRKLGFGCYDHIDDHKCDCTVTEQQCKEEKKHTWTDGCTSCDAATGVNNPDCAREQSWGCFSEAAHACMCDVSQNSCSRAGAATSTASEGSCYDHTTHKVSCNVEKASCSGSYYAPGYVSSRNNCCHCEASCANVSSSCAYYDAPQTGRWTHQCWSCCHESVWGCYTPGDGCRCDIAEGVCKRDFPDATWSNKCHECLAEVDNTAEQDDKDNTVMLAVVISTACVACVTVVLIATLVMYRMRMKQPSAGPPSPAVVVGVPAAEESNGKPDQSTA